MRGAGKSFINKSLFQIGKELRPKIDAVIMRNSLIPDAAVQDKAFFPGSPSLSATGSHPRRGAGAATGPGHPLAGRYLVRPWPHRRRPPLAHIFLKGYGYRMAGNAARAPITAALIEKVPGLVTANFSVMEAGGHIPRHWGMTKGMLTYHLALRAPRDTEKAHAP
jgi:beta-hydroxylase